MPLFQFRQQIGARYDLVANGSLADNSVEALDFTDAGVEISNDGGGISHSTSVNPERFVIEAPLNGKYLEVTACVRFASDAGQRFVTLLQKNSGGTTLRQYTVNTDAISGGFAASLPVSGVFKVSTGDFIQINMLQNSGGVLTIEADAASDPETGIAFIGHV